MGLEGWYTLSEDLYPALKRDRLGRVTANISAGNQLMLAPGLRAAMLVRTCIMAAEARLSSNLLEFS